MILDSIYAYRRDDVALAVAARPLEWIERAARDASPTRDFRAAIAAPGVSLIAETKKASPSKGVLISDYDPLALARDYESAGARAISVLTETRHFQGSLDDLTRVRAGVTIPCLRKDFIFDPYQVFEARAAGADAILLIVAMLDDRALVALRVLAEELDMTALVEVHDEPETARALDSGASVIGVNNRDLRTFDVDLATTERLRPLVPRDRLLVGESGIHTPADVARLAACGVDAILVGESLVRSGDVQAKVRELLA